MKSELVLVAMDSKEIIGIAGLERKYLIPRTYIILKREYQGKGLGTRFKLKLLAEARKKHNIITAVVEEKNLRSIKANLKAGAKIAGKRENLCYLFWIPRNIKGLFLYYSIKIVFPILKTVDIFRR